MDTNPFLEESSATRRPALHALPSETAPLQSVLRQALQSHLWIAASVRAAASEVGGLETLELLDDEPLRSVPLCWDAIGLAEREVVRAILPLIDAGSGDLYDSEHLVIAHRILERIAVNKPAIFHKAPVDRIAASLMWLVLRGNGQVHQRRGGITAQRVWLHFRVPGGSDRGRAMYAALGLPNADWQAAQWQARRADVWLCDPGLLHSTVRRMLIEERDELEHLCRRELEREALSRPLRRLGGRQVAISARRVVPSGAIFSYDPDGRPTVLVMLGGTMTDPDDVLAMSVDDAEDLVQWLDQALVL